MKDTPILDEELENEFNELNRLVEEYYRSKEFKEYVIQLEESMENLNINL